MVRYQVILAYDGTDFLGFQRLAGSQKGRTVQAVVETTLRRLGWQGRVWPPLDLDRLQAATQALPGAHDFAAFGSPPLPGGSTLRWVTQASWQPVEQDLCFTISANAFLYHMVRHLVNALVLVGQGKREASWIECALRDSSAERPQGLAPPQGLVLTEVRYAEEGAAPPAAVAMPEARRGDNPEE